MAHRRRNTDPGLGVNLSLIITPMLDMAFQLMAFFIMTFQPMSEEKNIVGKLLPPQREEQVKKKEVPMKGTKKLDKDAPLPDPDKKKDEKKGEEEKDRELDTKDDPIPKDVVRVIVETAVNINAGDASKSSDPGAIKLKFPEDAAPRTLSAVGDFAAGLNKLKTELDNWPGKANGKLQVEVHPDVRYLYFIQVQDVCRAARYKEMGFPKPVRPKK
jgi:biopolymer transport protein ExbD